MLGLEVRYWRQTIAHFQHCQIDEESVAWREAAKAVQSERSRRDRRLERRAAEKNAGEGAKESGNVMVMVD